MNKLKFRLNVKILNLVLFSVIILFIKDKNVLKFQENFENIAKDKVLPEQNELNITKDLVLGRFNYKTDTSFVKVSRSHTLKEVYLRKKTYKSFQKMYLKAKEQGIVLTIISGTRNFDEQKKIWERKWEYYKNLVPLARVKKILEFSSMPTISRHHWGTDIDLINLNNAYFDSKKGKKEYHWLVKNAKKFGFYQVYTAKEDGRTGYNLEKWHWSYLPIADVYLKYYNQHITYDDIKGFKGAKFAKKIKVIIDYVNGINPAIIKN